MTYHPELAELFTRTRTPRGNGYAAGLHHRDGDPHPRDLAARHYPSLAYARAEYVAGYWLGKDARPGTVADRDEPDGTPDIIAEPDDFDGHRWNSDRCPVNDGTSTGCTCDDD